MTEVSDSWVGELSTYLVKLQDRLFLSGLHTLGTSPPDEELASYLQAYFEDRLTIEDASAVVSKWQMFNEASKIKTRNKLSAL